MAKVLGLMMARNESQLISVSISHALRNYCDQVIVLVHDSTTSFEEEVSQLSSIWPNRIILLKLRQKKYHQKKAMRILCFISSKLDFDWIYPIDADEFGLSSDPSKFREYLHNLDSGVVAVRYAIENWISHKDFQSDDFGSFLKINERSIPAINLNLAASTMRAEIINGNLNFFDFAFDSKIIFRNRSPFVLEAGAHKLDELPAEQESEFPKGVFKVAHFPLLSREKLDLRAEQGKNLIEEGFLEWHGWQSQMIYDIQKNGKLDDFWIMHSANNEKIEYPETPYSSEFDGSFAIAIEPTIKYLKLSLGNELSTSMHFKDIDEYLELYDFLDLDWLNSNTRELSSSAVAERDSAVAERDSAVAERDSAVAERDSILNSTIWKLFTPYRKAKEFFRKS